MPWRPIGALLAPWRLKVAPFRDRDEKVQLSSLKVQTAKTGKIALAPYWRPIGSLTFESAPFRDRDEKVQLSSLKMQTAKTGKIALAPYWRPIGSLTFESCTFSRSRRKGATFKPKNSNR